jgi:hypothetical protein
LLDRVKGILELGDLFAGNGRYTCHRQPPFVVQQRHGAARGDLLLEEGYEMQLLRRFLVASAPSRQTASFRSATLRPERRPGRRCSARSRPFVLLAEHEGRVQDGLV